MNILVISSEVWRNTNNGGNVLSNIFSAFPDADIAQIYCCGEIPQNAVCRKYFQISDAMLLTRSKGRKLEEKDYSTLEPDQPESVDHVIKRILPDFLRETALLARECLWTIFNWRTRELAQFILDFKPDIIFAPCYSYFHVSKVALYAKKIAQCPMISYISDDNYSLKQFRFSPFFWINRLITRKWIRRHFAASELVYTMTELQKQEYERTLGQSMKVLCKSAEFQEPNGETGDPIRFIYAGGLYLNRWKILARLGKTLQAVNSRKVKAQLHIYSASNLRESQKKRLNDEENIFLHGALQYDKLMETYKKSDVAVHVEAFDLRNRLTTRLSFSTKIIDCMNSGCAILAVGPGDQAGISYLKENDAAICVTDIDKLHSSVSQLVCHPERIKEYALKAVSLGKKNHVKHDIDNMLRQDFFEIAGKSPKGHSF